MDEYEALMHAYSETCSVFSRYFRADISFLHLESLALYDVPSAILVYECLVYYNMRGWGTH